MTTVTQAPGELRVDQMLPGSWMDHLIAEKFLHLHLVSYTPGRTGPDSWADWVDRRGNARFSGPDGGFHPSTSRDHAMSLPEHWEKMYRGDFRLDCRNNLWHATFFRASEEFMGSASMWPLAICRAALKVSGQP